ncbi:MAG: rhodanese-like domain-containing protein [Thermoanaerobaculia bacterium]
MKKSPSSPSQPQSKSSRGFILGTLAGIVFASAVVWALIPSKAETQVPATTTVAATPAEDHEGHDHPDFKRISVDEAKAAIDRGEVTVLDVREMDAYLAGHIPGALHIPLTRVEGEIPYLPKGKPIVTYCTCPAEETSGAAAAILEKGGMQSMALTGGLGAWQQKGFQLASGQQ